MGVNTHIGRPGRVLVTGGAGFVGSHLAEELLARGHSVTALDNLTTGRLANIEHLLNEECFSLVIGDVTDEEIVGELTRDADAVFHLAAAVGVKRVLDDPLGSLETNVLGTEAVLKAAERRGAKVLLASTSEVYGKPDHAPQREDDDVILGPTSFSRWSYAAAKMLDEFLGLSFHLRTGLPVIVFRLFNTVGPRQVGTYGMVVPRFVEHALLGKPLPVHGNGRQSRCFLHVVDAVDAIVRLSRCPEAVGQVFNIGGVERVTILDLAQTVLDAVAAYTGDETLSRRNGRRGRGRSISFIPYDEAYPGGGFQDVRSRMPDISRITQVTGWQPARTLDDILRDVIEEQLSRAATGAARV